MSAEALTAAMEKLLKLHKSLYELAVKKTDMIKNGDMDALNQMLKDEQAHIAAIGKLEKDRVTYAKNIVPYNDNPTITDCLGELKGESKERIARLSDELIKAVKDIQDKNQLNQQLLHQSMQFVHFSMSLLSPQPQNYNYGPPSNKKIKPGNTSTGIFNSKA
ncbi:flagellar protein FlgN [Cytobacillus sp. SAFR-174]|uniref:flagellar protein FlgN n=1 Tax=Cytobacillus sp. SAFR-174 TaxID=3436868 RepID=UPI003F7EA5A6